MFLKDSDEIRMKVQKLIAGHISDEPVGMAVAFWGSGAEAMLPAGRTYRVICNLNMGSTNPAVIAGLLERTDVEVQHLPDLHAKVVIADAGAVVSSANFSANGLGLDPTAKSGLQEAGVFVPAGDSEFAKIYAWFAQRWQQASEVNPEVLAQAARQWRPRAGENAAPDEAEATDEIAEAAADVVPELAEGDLFQEKIKPRNAIRMAAPWLVDEYARMLGHPLTTSENYIPAYAAHVLWTASGKMIRTNINGTPEFSSPSQVFQRAKDRSAAFPAQVRTFVTHLAESPTASDCVRYWARRLVDDPEQGSIWFGGID